MDIYLIIDIMAAYVIDLIVGDPYWFPHPVRFIGWLIKTTEKILRILVNSLSKRRTHNIARLERIAGTILAVFTISVTFLIVFLVLEAAKSFSTVLFHVLNTFIIYTSFATRCLANEAYKVYETLIKKDIVKARQRVGMLVGRETDRLDLKDITRAVVETTAENTVDGILSPVIYAVLGSFWGIGAPLVYAFKTVSTLDSMVGYMNDKYINFGRTSAKIDDAANYIPARLSGLLIPAAAFVCGKGFVRSFRIMLRDRRNHKSPNCAYPEAAFAGALGIRLGGNNVYFGQVVEKPVIGDAVKELEANDIKEAVKLMYVASFLTLLLGLGSLGLILVV